MVHCVQGLDPYIIVFTSHIHTSTRSELNQICSTYYFAATLKWFITRRIGTRPQAINTLWLFIIIFEPQREILGSLLNTYVQNVKSCHWILNPFFVPFAVHFQVTMQARRRRGGRGGMCPPPHFLVDQLTLSQPGGTKYGHLITTGTPGLSDLPTALYHCSIKGN